MRHFVGAEFLDQAAQLGLVIAEFGGLGGVVRADDLLDRDGAGHRGALAQGRAGRAEREAGGVPQRRQRGRPHAALDDQLVEGGEVALLLLGHAADGRGAFRAAEHGELARVNARGAELAGMVDADHALDQRRGRQVSRQAVFCRDLWTDVRFCRLAAHPRALFAMMTAAAALKPANTAA